MLQNNTGILEGVEKIEKHLQKSSKQVTLNDVTSITGYHIDDSKKVMDKLIERYNTRLQITESGELIYDFGSYLHRRGERTWAEWRRIMGKKVTKILTLLFKIWIAATLIIYFTIFVIILIAIILGLSASNDDDNSSSNKSGLFDIIGALFRGIFEWNYYTSNMYYVTDNDGYNYRRYHDKVSPMPKSKKKAFTASVYDFVFGPKRVTDEHFANQQEVAAFLRENKGIITTAEVVGLAGWHAEEAENFMADCLARFKGEAEISENQILYGDFLELTQSKSTEGDADIIWYWDEYEAKYELTGNTKGRNAGIFAMNLFNLVFALIAPSIVIEALDLYNSSVVLIGLGVVPIVFSTIFFIIPLVRSFKMARKNKQRKINNIRKRLMKVIFEHYDQDISLEQLESWANQTTGKEKSLSKDEIKSIMQTLVSDLWGEMQFDTNRATISYRFQRLEDEIKEAQRLRANRSGDNLLGNVVFDSEN